jgi:hypothetical protein
MMPRNEWLNMREKSAGCAILLALLVLARPLGAQTVQSISAATPDLGRVVSASSGDTVFRIAASSGTITKFSGNGARLETGSSRALVTIACNSTLCRNKSLNLRVGSVGSPTGKAGPLTNFTIAPGSASIITAPSGTDPVSFTIAGLPNGGTGTFWVGADFPVKGNDSAGSTGAASSGFYVYVALSPNIPITGSTSGLAVARVFRPINVANPTGLAFGRIVRPTSGTGSVSIGAATGQRTVTGTGSFGITSPTPTRAAYVITGEGGQIFSLGIPSSFQMTGPGSPLTVNLTPTASGAQTLSSALGTAGSFSLGVGGSFSTAATTPAGAYEGSYAVTVQYN